MRLLLENDHWTTYYEGKKKKKNDTRVANTLIEWYRKGMGLSRRDEDIKGNLPLPWNIFDMNLLSVTEYGGFFFDGGERDDKMCISHKQS